MSPMPEQSKLVEEALRYTRYVRLDDPDGPDENLCNYVEELARRLEQAEQAMRLADLDASAAHDAIWAMDMATIMDSPTRTAFEFHREAASDAIWKIHNRLRAAAPKQPPDRNSGHSPEEVEEGADPGGR